MCVNLARSSARALQKTDTAGAERFFELSLERFSDGDCLLHSRESFDFIVNYYIGAENWEKAIETLEKQIEARVNQSETLKEQIEEITEKEMVTQGVWRVSTGKK